MTTPADMRAPELDGVALLGRVTRMSDMAQPPVSEAAVELLAALSKAILADPQTRAVPQYVALGYWLRPSAIKRHIARFVQSQPDDEILAPRGLALHLPPTNVDTIFVYSWALSVLAGNANLVRLPATLSAGAQSLLNVVCDTIDVAGQSERNLFCTYPYGGDLERDISACIDLRIIWGGDAKVESIARTPIRPDGLSIGFPDRQSLTLISGEAYGEADDTARADLATRLFNDAFWFDQMGCSSPRLLAWLGGDDPCRTDLYKRLDAVIENKGYRADPAVGVAKLRLANDFLAEGIGRRSRRYSNELQVTEVSDASSGLERATGGGFFADFRIESLEEVRSFVGRKVQTITHFGFGREELVELARSIAGRGGYRLVPVGEALQFETTWDGVPLLSHMTRRIVVRA